MNKVMIGVTEHEEGMEVKLTYENDRLVILAMNEAGHCSTRVDLIELLDWVKVNMPELMQREWVGLTGPEVDEAYRSVSDREWAIGGLADARVFFCAVEDKLKKKNT